MLRVDLIIMPSLLSSEHFSSPADPARAPPSASALARAGALVVCLSAIIRVQARPVHTSPSDRVGQVRRKPRVMNLGVFIFHMTVFTGAHCCNEFRQIECDSQKRTLPVGVLPRVPPLGDAGIVMANSWQLCFVSFVSSLATTAILRLLRRAEFDQRDRLHG